MSGIGPVRALPPLRVEIECPKAKVATADPILHEGLAAPRVHCLGTRTTALVAPASANFGRYRFEGLWSDTEMAVDADTAP
jgi:hypothetical protein